MESSASASRSRSTTPTPRTTSSQAIGTAIQDGHHAVRGSRRRRHEHQGRERGQHGRGRADPARDVRGLRTQEFATIQTVGTAGATGTGVTLTAPLTAAHASGVAAQDLGSGITLAAPLQKAHAVGSTVSGPTAGLISDGPQGQIVGVLNNDQNGINYPALHWGTDHYLNDLVNGGVGPWFNNINATPTTNTGSIYSAAGFARLQANLANVTAFRTNVESAVTRGDRGPGRRSTTTRSRSRTR